MPATVYGGDIVHLSAGWEYRWDASQDWRPMDMPDWAPRREGSGILYQRISLPETDAVRPAVFLPALMLSGTVSVDGVRVYPDSIDDGPEDFAGTPWILVDIPPDARNAELVVECSSYYFLIGIGGLPLYGDHDAILNWMIRGDIGYLVVGVVCAFLGGFFFVVFLRFRTDYTYLFFALLSVCMAIYSLNYSYTKQLFAPNGLFWFYSWLGSLILIPVGVLGFIDRLFFGDRGSIFRKLLYVHIGISVLALVAGMLLPQTAGNVSMVVLRVVYLSYFAAIIGFIAHRSLQKNTNAAIFGAGIVLFIAFGFRDVLVALGVTPWYRPAAHIGMLMFLGALSLILVRRLYDLYRDVLRYTAELNRLGSEREEMINELHDGIGGVMTNIHLLAQMRIQEAPPGFVSDLNTISVLSRNGLSEIRRFMRILDDGERDWTAFLADIRIYLREVLKPLNISYNVSSVVSDDVSGPDGRIYLNTYRIFQEAITNIVKHAGAAAVRIDFTVDDHGIRLEISDDGTARDSSSDGTGRGLNSMKQRAFEIGGEVTVAFGRGTTVLLVIPPKNNPIR